MRNFLKFLFSLFIFIGALAGLLRPFSDYFPEIPRQVCLGILVVIAAPIIAALVYFPYRIWKVNRQRRQTAAKRFERVKPLYDALESGRGINEDDVHPFAAGVSTRLAAYQLLLANNLTEIFPREFSTIEKAAEGYLVAWLEDPNELGAIPNDIQHVKCVTIESGTYQVFKFRIDDPHWAAPNGWMLGLVGPYSDDSEPYDFPDIIFSRLNHHSDDDSPEDEVQWIHENIL